MAALDLQPNEAAATSDHQHNVDILKATLAQLQPVSADTLPPLRSEALNPEEKHAAGRQQTNAQVVRTLMANGESNLEHVLGGN